MKPLHRSPDLIVAAISVAIGLGALAVIPSEIKGQSLSAIADMNSPAFFPILAAGAMTLCAVALAFKAVAEARAGAGAEFEFKRRFMVLAVMGLFALFAIATRLVGMIPSAAVTILLMGGLLGYRKRWLLLLVAVAVPTTVYLLFERLLLILLPRGVLFS